MKTRVVYNPSADILPTCEILNARCTCPAGKDPAFCKHTFALLHAIDDYIRKEMFSVSTERLQTWHKPRPTKKDPTKASLLFKCRCTKASTLDSNKFAFKKSKELFTRIAVSGGKKGSFVLQQVMPNPFSAEWLILKQKNSSVQHIPAVKYGLETEDRVRSMVQHMYPQSIVRKTVLVIHPLEQYIAASPDGLIRSVSSKESKVGNVYWSKRQIISIPVFAKAMPRIMFFDI
ncbi:hypothetical protein NPIL_271811 [Nephila pilipes]|uniref:SWIM-type domain-containing protein n=1 Tax=Nephila pilipes TaxID=299642 RepID=A0A8X6IMP0_NEPPI|nr:hypothetical protein NPIL_271811 [Nephila pilipes]